MIKSVHNEIDKLMFGLLYAGYLSERLQKNPDMRREAVS